MMHTSWDGVTQGEREADARGGWLAWLLAGYVACFPVQFELPGLTLRLAPSDCFLLAAALLCVGRLTIRPAAWGLWHLGLLGLILASTAARAVSDGGLAGRLGRGVAQRQL